MAEECFPSPCSRGSRLGLGGDRHDWKQGFRRTCNHHRPGRSRHPFSGVRPFFCQVETAESAIWLTEVAPQSNRGKRVLDHLAAANTRMDFELLSRTKVFNLLVDYCRKKAEEQQQRFKKRRTGATLVPSYVDRSCSISLSFD